MTVTMEWVKVSGTQYKSNSDRFLIWHSATTGFRLNDLKGGRWYGPFSKLDAAKAKAVTIVQAEGAMPPRRVRGRPGV